jgi:hypothetical protein
MGMKGLWSSPVLRLYEEDDLSGRATAFYLCAFAVVAFYAFYSNGPCLFFDWDGVAWAVNMDNFERLMSSFSTAMIDPLQGMFEIPYQGYRGGLPQAMIMHALGMPSLNRTVTHIFYASTLVLAVYAAGVTAGFSRKVALLGAFLLAATTLPMFTDAGYLENLGSLNPNYTYIIALTVALVALGWSIDGRSWRKTAGLMAAMVLLLLYLSWTFILYFSFVALTVLVLGVASLFADRSRVALRAKLVAAGSIIVVLLAAGVPQYLSDIGANSALWFFGIELSPLTTPPKPGLANFADFIASGIVGYTMLPEQWLMSTGVVGALFVVATTRQRKLRAFAWGYIALFIVYLGSCVAAQVWQIKNAYEGPSLYRVVSFISPLGSLFVAALVWSAVRAALTGVTWVVKWVLLPSLKAAWAAVMLAVRFFWVPSLAVPSFTAEPRAVGVHGAIPLHVILALALAIPAAMAAVDNPGAATKRCTRPYFLPLERNAVVDYLIPRAAVDIGKPYNGSVATITGLRHQQELVWVDNVTADHRLWYYSGNDLRTIGLWKYHIPTLTEVNIALTAPYFLTVAEFLAEPADKQARSLIGITRPNAKMMALWGVRYVIADHPLQVGTERLEMPVKVVEPSPYQSPIRLYELSEPNLGNYSPTEVERASDATATLALMKRPEFDGRHVVVTDADLHGSFVPARDASMTVIDGGVALHANSDGDSILVLPVQYSHCWVATGDGKLAFFRANMMQLGVRFSGRLSSEIKYRFGPFWQSSCRRLDAADSKRLNVTAARAHRQP